MLGLNEGYIKTQESPEVRLHYVEDAQNEKAPIVLLLHGFPEFWYAWKDYLAPLANAGFHPVAIDLRGYNKSSHPKGVGQYAIERLVDDVKSVIQKFNKKTFIVGHDWGGIIAWELASRYPSFCEGVVVINAPHTSAWMDTLTAKKLKYSWYAWAFRLPKVPELWLKNFNFKLVENFLSKHSENESIYTRDEMKNYKNALSKDRTLKSAMNYYKANMKSLSNAEKLKNKKPTLLIWGKKDVDLETSMLKDMQDYMDAPLIKKFYPEGSHWIHRERPKEILKEMLSFFKSLQVS